MQTARGRSEPEVVPVAEWDKPEFDFLVPEPEYPMPALGVRWCARELIRPEIPVPTAKVYRYALIKFALDGQGSFASGDAITTVRNGSVFWTLPGYDSVISTLPNHSLANYAVCLFGTELATLVRHHLGAPSGAAPLHNAHRVRSIFENILEEAIAGGPEASGNCAHLAHVLLQRIGANMIGGHLRKNTLTRRTFLRCREYMNRHFAAIHSLVDVSGPCGLTQQHLCNLFDKFEGCTPHAYLKQRKMAKAEDLLSSGTLSIADVARAVGYSNPRSFSRNFRSVFKRNPAQYRKSR